MRPSPVGCGGATGPRKWLTPAAWVGAVAALLLLVFPLGFPNYDTIYALVWGRELAHGVSPDYGAALPPTPHPLADLLGLVTTPLGDGAIAVTMVVAYASLGLIGYLVYRLGSLWFDRWIGAVAAVIVLTRAPYLSNGLRAYIDLPFIALCLGALTIEARRTRAGWPVLALLVPAGLLRPEAWLFAGRLLALPGLRHQADGTKSGVRVRLPSRRRVAVAAGAIATGARLAGAARRGGAAALGPLRRCHDRRTALLVDGDQGNGRHAETPHRPGRPGPLGAARARRSPPVAGDGRRRRGPRARLRLPAPPLARSASPRRSSRSAPSRYSPSAGWRSSPATRCSSAALLSIFVALALLGWRLLEPGHPWRRRWQAFAGLVALMFVALASQPVGPRLPGPHRPHQPGPDRGRPHRPGRRRRLRSALRQDRRAQPPRRPPPRLRPRSQADRDRQRQRGRRSPASGYFLKPASPFVIHNFILDPNDPTDFRSTVPQGFRTSRRQPLLDRLPALLTMPGGENA